MAVLLVPLLFVLAAVAVMVAVARKSLMRQRERKALATQNPDQPWLWRRDWANRAVEDTTVVSAGFLWFFGIAWLVITTPVAFVFSYRVREDPFYWITLLFPLVGILVVLSAAYQTLRRRKYGVSICHLEHLPVPIGKTLRGSIVARVRDLPAEGFRLKLTNLRRRVTGSGKNRSVRETVLWQDEQVVRTGAMPNPEGLRIPFTFAIPRDGEPADDRDRNDRVIWRLDVEAEVPGIDYKSQFELPVFATGEVDDAWTPEVDPRGWTPAPESGITLGMAPNGEEIRTAPTQRAVDWIALVVFFAFWFGILAAITAFGAPLFIAPIFGLIGLLVLLMLGDLFVGRSRVIVASGSIVVRRTWLGLGPSPRTIDAANIDSVATQVGMTSGSRVYHDVVIKLRDGGSVRALRHIPLRRDAEMVAAKVRRITTAGSPAAARS